MAGRPFSIRILSAALGIWLAALGLGPGYASAQAASAPPAPAQASAGGEGEGARDGIATLVAALDRASRAIAAEDAEAARAALEDFVAAWPGSEDDVKARSHEVYEETEADMPRALALLSADPPRLGEAAPLVARMRERLAGLDEPPHYTAWDAGVILLREGLEAMLVVVALLSFLSRTGEARRRVWVWVGAAAGVGASVLLAFLLHALLSAAAAGVGAELVEGIAGLVSVALLFTVGAWLHSRASLAVWHGYVKRQVGRALARGALLSLALASFLAVTREGAETAIFYLGLAPGIRTPDLVLGIAGGALALVLAGAVLVRFGLAVPVRPFFLAAEALIDYLALKFAGTAVHALQAVGLLPAHPAAALPTWPWIGLYPTWESVLAQVALLVLIASAVAWTERRVRRAVAEEDAATA